MDKFDSRHGHVDILPPDGCDIETYQGEILSPVEGNATVRGGPAYFITLPEGVYIKGIENVLLNAGVDNFNINNIGSISINFGHLIPMETKPSFVNKGQVVGDIQPEWGISNPIKLGYQITIIYKNSEYMFSPSVFVEAHEGPDWLCVNQEYGCEIDFLWYP